MKGYVQIYQGSKLLHEASNEIHLDLYDYLHSRMVSGSQNFALTNLFDEFQLQADGEGGDGIIFRDVLTQDWWTMRTEFITSPSSASRRLSGFIIPEEEPIEIQNFALGKNLQDPAVSAGGFQTQYASFALEDPVVFSVNVPISVVWQITIE